MVSPRCSFPAATPILVKLYRIVLSDLHLVTGSRPGKLDPFEDFFHDERFAELLAHYGEDAEAEVEKIGRAHV